MHPFIAHHRATILALAARYGIDDIRVFGSMARGDADANSDIDLLVALPSGKSGLALGGLLADVEELTQRKVDVITEASLHPALRERILREAHPL
ncbi:nucleotidyltransferase [Chromatium weissei]|nr:nucleotidyltransferase [Chromatium weissei]